MPQAFGNTGPSLLAALGNPEKHPQVMSGIPWHLLSAGSERGLFDGAVPTMHYDDLAYRAKRAAWSVGQLVRRGRAGGFGVTDAGIEHVWRRVQVTGSCRIMNCLPLYPRWAIEDQRIARWYFIDQTLAQNFEGYEYGTHISPLRAAKARDLERAGYMGAEGIVVNSSWAADSVINEYGVPAERVHVVLQAASLGLKAIEEWAGSVDPPTTTADRPLRLVFVGREWHRKGLDRLLRGFSEAVEEGSAIELSVIGLDASDVPKELRRFDRVNWYGLINKARDERRFIDLVGSHDVGCLLSRREAGGVGLHEYHALGLAVLGTTAGGAGEQVLGAASLLLDPSASTEVIAAAITELANDRERVGAMRRYSWDHRKDALWPARVEQILRFWPGRDHLSSPMHPRTETVATGDAGEG
jgi:glycosyltransferase involved in cell wall biosynthesis